VKDGSTVRRAIQVSDLSSDHRMPRPVDQPPAPMQLLVGRRLGERGLGGGGSLDELGHQAGLLGKPIRIEPLDLRQDGSDHVVARKDSPGLGAVAEPGASVVGERGVVVGQLFVAFHQVSTSRHVQSH
jgi:hypothetical protein